MKRIGKVFWGLLCMILLFSLSHASDNNISAKKITTKEKVAFAWNAVTTYTNDNPIGKKDGIVKYEVYIYQVKNIDEKPTKKMNIDGFKHKDGIEETSCEIKFDKPGYYFLGVRAKLLKNGIELRSDVSWSCSKTCTNKNPQYVEVSE